MKKSAFAAALVIAAGFALAGPALAKGGHGGGHGGRGHGHGHSMGHHHHGAPAGWSRGRKIGWRGHGCPPGLRKQVRC